MSKLISAGISRLWKNRIFWVSMGTLLAYSVIYMLSGVRDAQMMTAANPGYQYSIDEYYFHFALTIGLFCAVFSSMFLGAEYSDGTIRNKIVTGCTRTEIYLSSLILTFLASLMLIAAWLIGGLVGIPALGLWKMDISWLCLYLLASIFMTAAFSAIFTLIGMLSSSKSMTALLSVLLFFALLLYASMIYNALAQPEMTNDIFITANGIQMGDPVPNPHYISGTTRLIYEFLVDFLPTGQGIQIWMLEAVRFLRMLLSSLGIVLVSTLLGIRIFKKKNLK